MPHPAVLIVIWLTSAVIVQLLPGAALAASSLVLPVLAWHLDGRRLGSLLRRTRWIAFSLLLIYAYTTPGTALVETLGRWSPTQQGLFDGLLQLGRLLCMLATLAVLLSLLTTAKFIAGIHVLAWPLRGLGMSRERIAVRLALTLEYAEPAMRDTAADWRQTIHAALRPPAGAGGLIELHTQGLRWIDAVCLVACAGLMAGVWR